MNEDYCVICGKYIGENNRMFCEECRIKYSEKKEEKNEKKDLTDD